MLVQAISAAQYIGMRNNAALSMINMNNARLGMLSSIAYNPSFASLETLNAIDTQFELQAITNSLEYKMAKAMLEQVEKQQKEEAKHLNVFA